MAIPDRRARTRPLELLGLSGGLAIFLGLIVLMSTRDLILALIFLGVGFIVALVAFAMIALAITPPEPDADGEHPPTRPVLFDEGQAVTEPGVDVDPADLQDLDDPDNPNDPRNDPL